MANHYSTLVITWKLTWKEKVLIIFHIFAPTNNNSREAVWACLYLVAHIDKTSKGKVGTVASYPPHRFSIKVNPQHYVERSSFLRKTHIQKISKVTWTTKGSSQKTSLDIDFSIDDILGAWPSQDHLGVISESPQNDLEYSCIFKFGSYRIDSITVFPNNVVCQSHKFEMSAVKQLSWQSMDKSKDQWHILKHPKTLKQQMITRTAYLIKRVHEPASLVITDKERL